MTSDTPLRTTPVRHDGETAIDIRHVCDFPLCSERGSGHPLACNCRSASAPARVVVDLNALASLQQSVVFSARRFTRIAAEFPDDPSIWAESLDFLHDAMKDLDEHLDREFPARMA